MSIKPILFHLERDLYRELENMKNTATRGEQKNEKEIKKGQIYYEKRND